MGRAWDRLGGGERRTSKPGIGERDVEWVSNRGWNSMRCRNCGHLSHGGSPCKCDEPDFAPADNRMLDMQRWHYRWALEALRVAKPGAHLIAFGGTRTYHRLAAAIEDAGWEIRDTLVWAYASGMPKSFDISKGIDKAAGVEREVIRTEDRRSEYDGRERASQAINTNWRDAEGRTDYRDVATRVVTSPATEEAQKWAGWATSLKPAWEPIVLARKPLIGTVVKNVLAHGTGALNIDATRIGTTKDVPASPRRARQGPIYGELGADPGTGSGWDTQTGRWPANVVLTDAIFDGGVKGVVGGGERSSGVMKAGTKRSTQSVDYGDMPEVANLSDTYGDSGGVSRFFVIPKAARSEKEPAITPEGHTRTNRYTLHPTVKPLELMRHLVRLVTPPGGIVLDPFLGSGTTALAAEQEGFRWVGIEKEPEYVDMARARLNGNQQGLGL